MAFSSNSITGVDLAPAETELRRVYTDLLAEIQRLGNAGYGRWHSYGNSQAYLNWSPFKDLPALPVLHIVPKGRRVEYGWFRQGTWTTTSTQIASAMGVQGAAQTHDEVFIAGEALGWTPEELVRLVIHQIIHQFAKESSTTTHHSRNMESLARYIGYRRLEKHKSMGFCDWGDPDNDLAGVITAAAASLNQAAFNIVRNDEANGEGSGRMKQWTCECGSPKLYTGGVLMGTCDKCGKPFVYSHKDRWSTAIIEHMAGRGFDRSRVKSWTCPLCGNEHDHSGKVVNYYWQYAKYPDPCRNADPSNYAKGVK
jgi:hypothetical protein